MKIYKFCDWSLTDDEDYDVVGEEYKNLIKCCCNICDVVSFIIERSDICSKKIQEELSRFSIARPKNITYRFQHYGDRSNNEENLGIHYYQASPELCELLLRSVSSIFDWVGFRMPEDPTFYRSDGSVFFTSTTHEGILTLMPREDEDVSDIISCGIWLEEVI